MAVAGSARNGRRPEAGPPARRSPAPRPIAASPTVWWACVAHPGPGPVENSLVAVRSDRFPDGARVDLSDTFRAGRRPAGWLVDLRYRAADRAVVRIALSAAVATLRQPVWFAELAHATSPIPSASLVAFAGLDCPPGALLTPSQVAARGLRMQDRIAEIRWWIRSGVVDTVSVEEPYRGQGLGRALVTAAEALRMLRGWAPLTVQGQAATGGRTDASERREDIGGGERYSHH